MYLEWRYGVIPFVACTSSAQITNTTHVPLLTIPHRASLLSHSFYSHSPLLQCRFVGTLSMMYGSSSHYVTTVEMGTAGKWMIFALTFGLVGGSFFSFALKAAICACNPFTG